MDSSVCDNTHPQQPRRGVAALLSTADSLVVGLVDVGKKMMQHAVLQESSIDHSDYECCDNCCDVAAASRYHHHHTRSSSQCPGTFYHLCSAVTQGTYRQGTQSGLDAHRGADDDTHGNHGLYQIRHRRSFPAAGYCGCASRSCN